MITRKMLLALGESTTSKIRDSFEYAKDEEATSARLRMMDMLYDDGVGISSSGLLALVGHGRNLLQMEEAVSRLSTFLDNIDNGGIPPKPWPQSAKDEE